MTRFERFLITAAGATWIAAAASGAWASGSVGAAGSAPNPYREGQTIYARKVACKSCAFPGGLKDMASVDSALQKIASGEIALDPAERSAVTSYIKRRFKGS